MDVAAWLRGLGLERYAQAFRNAEVTPEILPELIESDLRELGLPLGPRKTVLKAGRDLAARPTPATSVGTAPGEAEAEAERRQLTVMFVNLALLRRLKRLSARGPVPVVFEDARWIDPSSRELLDLAAEAHAHAVTTVASE